MALLFGEVMMTNRFKFRMWDSFANKYFDEETDPLFENVYECMKQQIFYDGGNPLYGRLAYNHTRDGRVFEQCTGLRDKNGRLIFEGDIVELTRSRNYGWCRRGRRLKVQWNTFNCCGFGFGAIGNLTRKCAENCIVIGNIHENPDLLENKE